MSTIFVSIASYRDRDCAQTVESLDSCAKYPERITYGIVEQNDADHPEENCISDYQVKGKVFRKTVPHTEAKGPQIARQWASELYVDEHFYFQIDSHTLVVESWDTKLVDMFYKEAAIRQNDDFVFSHYTSDWNDYDTVTKKPKAHVEKQVPRICKALYHDDIGVFSLHGAHSLAQTERPYHTPWLASGFLFGKGRTLMQVPWDPKLENVFVGEEFSHALRLWTHGIDIVTPTEQIAFHYYTRENSPHWWDLGPPDNKVGLERVRALARGEQSLIGEEHGLGTARSVASYYEFAGIDLEDGVITKNFCKLDNKEDRSEWDYYRDKNATERRRYRRLAWCGGVLVVLTMLLIVLVLYRLNAAKSHFY